MENNKLELLELLFGVLNAKFYSLMNKYNMSYDNINQVKGVRDSVALPYLVKFPPFAKEITAMMDKIVEDAVKGNVIENKLYNQEPKVLTR